jgi:hypothetical protein
VELPMRSILTPHTATTTLTTTTTQFAARFAARFAALVATLFASPLLAAVPTTLTIDGVLSAPGGGAVVDGPYKLTFALWDADKDGTKLWSETVDVAISGGRFAAVVGAGTALDAATLAGGKAFLGVAVANDPELPRRALTAAPFALRAAVAETIACTACLGAGAVAFNYAGSTTKGGPANDLACTACVGVGELAFDGDVDLGGNSLKAKNATLAGDLVAKTVTATSFAGDGSKLTGIAQPKGSCKAGEAVVGIASDGSLQCKAVSGALPPDGLDEVSNGLLTTQFLESLALAAPVAIPDNTGASANANLDVPDWGIAQGLTVKVKLANTDLASVALKLLPPNDKKVGLVLCDPCGDKDAKSLDTAWSDKVAPKSGDLAAWVGANAKGGWTLVAVDTGYCIKQAPGNATLCDVDAKLDGAIEAFSIEVATLSTKKAAVKGDLDVDGALAVGGKLTSGQFQLPRADKPPVTCDAAAAGYLYMDTALVALRVCNGSAWATIALVVWGTQDKPGLSCADILTKMPSATSGLYWLDPDGNGGVAAYQGYCEMTLEGGGWTRVLQLKGAQDKSLGGVPNSQEYVDNGTWQFSKTMLKASNREVLVVETVSPFRMHLYDFKQYTNPIGEDFVGTIAGDRAATVAVWNWTKKAWQSSGAGNCNSNNHSQWNCTPANGVRFHYATRDWTGDGGSSENDGWNWFTGYNQGYGNYAELVKNWNGAYNQTPHALFVR